MKKLIIAALLAATTQAQAYTAERCGVIVKAIAYASTTEEHCNVKDMGLTAEMIDKYEHSNCPSYPKSTQYKWRMKAAAEVMDRINRRGADACVPLVEAYKTFTGQ